MGVAAFLYLTQIDVNGLDFRNQLMVVDADNVQIIVAADDGNVAVFKIDHFVGVFHDRTGIGTKEKLVLANAHDERTLLSGSDYLIGIGFVEQSDGVSPDNLMERHLNGLKQLEIV